MPESTESSPDPFIGRLIANKLRLETLLGEGATGRVYRAHHLGFERDLAVKVLSLRTMQSRSVIADRFRLEARVLIRIDHPNVVRVLDFGEDGPEGSLYLVMEYLEGEDLKATLQREKRLSLPRTADIMHQVLDALSAAHALDIIHRDIKPANVFRLGEARSDGRDQVKVCDFGIARTLGPDEESSSPRLTQADSLLGTPSFMAPEQVLRGETDARTDLYACGAMMYKLLTGSAPLFSKDRTEHLRRLLNEAPAAPSSLVPDLSPVIDAFVLRALAKKQALRFQTAEEMRRALDTSLEKTSAAGARAAAVVKRQHHEARRSGNRITIVLALLLAAFVLTFFVNRRFRSEGSDSTKHVAAVKPARSVPLPERVAILPKARPEENAPVIAEPDSEATVSNSSPASKDRQPEADPQRPSTEQSRAPESAPRVTLPSSSRLEMKLMHLLARSKTDDVAALQAAITGTTDAMARCVDEQGSIEKGTNGVIIAQFSIENRKIAISQLWDPPGDSGQAPATLPASVDRGVLERCIAQSLGSLSVPESSANAFRAAFSVRR